MVGNGVTIRFSAAVMATVDSSMSPVRVLALNDHVGVILGPVAHLISKYDQRMIILTAKLREDRRFPRIRNHINKNQALRWCLRFVITQLSHSVNIPSCAARNRTLSRVNPKRRAQSSAMPLNRLKPRHINVLRFYN